MAYHWNARLSIQTLTLGMKQVVLCRQYREIIIRYSIILVHLTVSIRTSFWYSCLFCSSMNLLTLHLKSVCTRVPLYYFLSTHVLQDLLDTMSEQLNVFVDIIFLFNFKRFSVIEKINIHLNIHCTSWNGEATESSLLNHLNHRLAYNWTNSAPELTHFPGIDKHLVCINT